MATERINKKERIKRQHIYIELITSHNVTQSILQLQNAELTELYQEGLQQSQNKKNTTSDADIKNQMIDIQCNNNVGKITMDELKFLRSYKLKPTTLVNYVQEYRSLIKQHMPARYLELQRKYKIQRKKRLNEIQQQCLHADDLDIAINDLQNHPSLVHLNQQMQQIRENNPAVRNLQIALYKMTAGKNTHSYIKNQTHQKRIKQQQDLELVDQTIFLAIAEKLLDITCNEYTSANNIIRIHRLLMGICALTGRRQIEVIKLGKFEYNETHSLLFEGQAKTQGINRLPAEIPVLISSRTILNAHQNLKVELQNNSIGNPLLTNKQTENLLFTQSSTRGLIMTTFRNIYPDNQIPQKISLRSIYADIAYELFHPNMSKLQYFQRILGHSSTTSADAYIKNTIR